MRHAGRQSEKERIRTWKKHYSEKRAWRKISSPESLNDYLHVTSPSVWLILTAVILLLAGMLVWSSVASIDSFATGTGRVTEGTMYIYFDNEQIAENVQSGMTVTAGETAGHITSIGTDAEGELFVVCYLPEDNQDEYSARSWHYSYLGNKGRIINHKNTDNKKILVLGDSYDAVTNCFLALGVSEVEGLVMRSYNGNIREYIKNNNFSTVIVAYASFMIGAHDNKKSANYKMFSFE